MLLSLRVLVTGANGFIASHACDELVKRGFETTGLVREKSRIERLGQLGGKKNFEICECDLLDFEKLAKIFCEKKFDCVLHLAALNSPKILETPFEYFDSNVKATLNVLEACRINEIKKIVYSSTTSVYGNAKYLPVDEKHPVNPKNFYGLTKFLGEEICRNYSQNFGISAIVLRYSGVFGPRRSIGGIANFVKCALNNQSPNVLEDMKWDTLYVKDVAKATVNALEKLEKMNESFEIVNLGSGKAYSTLELAEKIVKLSGSIAKAGFSGKKSSFNFYFNIEKAKKFLKFTPSNIDESILDYLNDERGNSK